MAEPKDTCPKCGSDELVRSEGQNWACSLCGQFLNVEASNSFSAARMARIVHRELDPQIARLRKENESLRAACTTLCDYYAEAMSECPDPAERATLLMRAVRRATAALKEKP